VEPNDELSECIIHAKYKQTGLRRLCVTAYGTSFSVQGTNYHNRVGSSHNSSSLPCQWVLDFSKNFKTSSALGKFK